jgi:hypothetical protein
VLRLPAVAVAAADEPAGVMTVAGIIGGGGAGVALEAPGVVVGAKTAVNVSLGVGKMNAVGGAAPGRSQLMAAATIRSGARSQIRGRMPASDAE